MAKPPVDPTALWALLRATFPDMSPLEALNEGEDSRAFAFQAGNTGYVVRINASAAGFEKDRLAFAQFFSSAVPVPEVVQIARLGTEAWLCVSARLPGMTLQALPRGGAFAYGEALGGVMDAMAATPVNGTGAGPLGADGNGCFSTWPDFIADVSRWTWEGLAEADQAFAAQVVSDAERMAHALPDRRQLVHGDFGSNNVLVGDGRVTGVIDWSEAMLGDPLYDLANLLFWRPWLDCMEQQCRYFEIHQPERLRERDTLLTYQLRIGLQTLHDAMRDGDGDMMRWTVQRCADIRLAAKA
ncbi:aminoglycoside phosphotransferase family protein [Devosia sediminis]|uniref:Aminoglycoside phosphotransferase family protein n=1 Tax=Devosia sediminis TaxID=2798801 RepID=A0A934MHK8_9HYPH|nr:aminoglycoside phosphotransferase family protein [Devosia sediminis]MBJ3785207.1 aminoglycoside phosphotransferase family protein [Devosia sediminis]